MSACLAFLNTASILEDIVLHPSWHGEIRGLDAEKLLRGSQTPYLYLIRTGEKGTQNEINFYISFVLPDLSVRHQPVVITIAPEGWYYENGMPGGPYLDATIDDVLHLIMHCNKEQCIPLLEEDSTQLTKVG